MILRVETPQLRPWVINTWIVFAVAAAIAALTLSVLLAVSVLEIARGLGEFRAVIDGIGLP